MFLLLIDVRKIPFELIGGFCIFIYTVECDVRFPYSPTDFVEFLTKKCEDILLAYTDRNNTHR